MSVEMVEGRLRPTFWKTGGFFQCDIDTVRWPQFKRAGKHCIVCGKRAGFFWRWRKLSGARWTCAEHWLHRDGSFLDMTRAEDDMIGINGEEIIALQFGHQRNVEVTPEQEKAVRDEMKRRGWKW